TTRVQRLPPLGAAGQVPEGYRGCFARCPLGLRAHGEGRAVRRDGHAPNLFREARQQDRLTVCAPVPDAYGSLAAAGNEQAPIRREGERLDVTGGGNGDDRFQAAREVEQ